MATSLCVPFLSLFGAGRRVGGEKTELSISVISFVYSQLIHCFGMLFFCFPFLSPNKKVSDNLITSIMAGV